MNLDDLDDLDLTPEERRVARRLQAKARERELERSIAAKLAAKNPPAGVLVILPHDAPPDPGEGEPGDQEKPGVLVVRLPAPVALAGADEARHHRPPDVEPV